MDTCINHPDHAALEWCELCHKPLCGLCLWYTRSGHRLCEEHAREWEGRGESVLSPDDYEEALAASLRQQPTTPNGEVDETPGLSRGNSNDLLALVGATAALTTLFSCAGGAYCLPVLILIIGLVTFMNAGRAVDPRRTRVLAGASVGIVAVMLLFIVAFFLLYVSFVILAINTGGP